MNKTIVLLILTIACSMSAVAQERDSTYFRAEQWREQLDEYRREDIKAFPAHGSILFIGSSTIRMWNNLDGYFPTHRTLNRGFGGAWLSDIIYHFQEFVAAYRPSQIVLYAGANDLSNGIPAEKVFEDIKCFVRLTEIHLPSVPIVLLSFRTTPSTANKAEMHSRLNAQIKEYFKDNAKVTFLDVSSMMYGADGKFQEGMFRKDRLHPTAKAYRMMADEIEPLLTENNAGRSVFCETSLPRTTPESENVDAAGMETFLLQAKKAKMDVHSLMVLRGGKVVYEKWLGKKNGPDVLHVLNSVSKTFTATAVGFAVDEGYLKVTDKVISFFPDKLPATIGDNLKEMTVENLLTMTCGSLGSAVDAINKEDVNTDWVEAFLAAPAVNCPGTVYEYSSMSTYMLSAIIQKVTGQKVVDYLEPRLFTPLGIEGINWLESPQGINTGGWGLYVKTEDLAKLGQLFLQNGRWKGRQLLSASWVKEASSYKVASVPSGVKMENISEELRHGDWTQGYGYQMWRCRYNAYRADGAQGQYIIVMPEKDAVVVVTANIGDMQAELNLVWKHILPALK